MAGDGPAYYPMARAIAGGLAFSTVVSLLFLPTIYAILDDLRNGTSRVIRRARGTRGATPVEGAVVAMSRVVENLQERPQPRSPVHA